MLKKGLIVIGIFIVVIGVVAFNTKFYYPALPIESISKKEVLETINDSSEDIVKFADEGNYEWYITRKDSGKAHDHIKNMISKAGWEFTKQEGNGYFFEKENQTLIITTQNWTKDFVLVQVPIYWNL